MLLIIIYKGRFDHVFLKSKLSFESFLSLKRGKGSLNEKKVGGESLNPETRNSLHKRTTGTKELNGERDDTLHKTTAQFSR